MSDGEPPSAILNSNGTAFYFDEDGEQISELQRKGWRGVHEFFDRYPDAYLSIAIGKKQIHDVKDKDIIEKIVEQIKEPEEAVEE